MPHHLKQPINLGYNAAMDLPSWMLPDPSTPSSEPSVTYDWMGEAPRKPRKPKDEPPVSKEVKALMITQFEIAFPRVLESIYNGATLKNALAEYPIDLDPGAFTAWLYKDARRKTLYQEAKELRAEAWTSRMLDHAEGETLCDIDRSKFAVDTYKWLISRQARKEYGDTKTIEMNTTISVTAALNQAQARVIDVDAEEMDLMDSSEFKQLSSGSNHEENDDG